MILNTQCQRALYVVNGLSRLYDKGTKNKIKKELCHYDPIKTNCENDRLCNVSNVKSSTNIGVLCNNKKNNCGISRLCNFKIKYDKLDGRPQMIVR